MAIWNGHRGKIIKNFISQKVLRPKRQLAGGGKEVAISGFIWLKTKFPYGEAIAEIIFLLHSVKFEMISQDCLSVRKYISSSAKSNGKSFPRWLSVRKNALGVDVTLESGFEVLTQNIMCKRRNAGYPE
jgi:hypothetical protein